MDVPRETIELSYIYIYYIIHHINIYIVVRTYILYIIHIAVNSQFFVGNFHCIQQVTHNVIVVLWDHFLVVVVVVVRAIRL